MKKNTGKKRTRRSNVDYDEFWKNFVLSDLKEILAFDYQELYEAIDFTRPIEAHPTELQKLAASYGKKGGKTADLLLKAYLKPEYVKEGESDETWLLIHFEIEISPATEFSFRMFKYFIRALDGIGKEVIAIAIFPGAKPQPHHKRFERKRFRTKIVYEYYCLDAHKWTDEELLEKDSIVAIALLACKRAVRTRNDYDLRFTYKRELLKLIKERGYPPEQAERILNFVFFTMYLPKDMDEKILNEIYQEYQENMTTTEISPYMAERADLFFKVFIENTTGKSFKQYKKEQKAQLAQIEVLQKENLLLEQKAEQEKQKAEQEKQKAEQEKQKAEQEKQKAEQEKQKAEQEKQKAEQEKQKAEQEKQKAEQEKQKAEQEKQLLEQKAEQEKKASIIRLSKILSISDIAMAWDMKEDQVLEIINQQKTEIGTEKNIEEKE